MRNADSPLPHRVTAHDARYRHACRIGFDEKGQAIRLSGKPCAMSHHIHLHRARPMQSFIALPIE